MEFYDYIDILNSNFFRQNPELSKGLVWQIIIIIMRMLILLWKTEKL